MQRRLRIAMVSLVALASAGALVIYACSGKSSSPTYPVAGGGALELNSPSIAANGGNFSHTFMNAGTFPYHCAFHAGMTGTVTVTATGTPSTPSLAMVTSSPYTPLTVAAGSTVTWNNGSTAVHTVTSN